MAAPGGVGCRGGPARLTPRARGSTATVRNPDLHDAVGGFGATVIAPDGFREQGPFDVILELVGAVNMMDNLKALEHGRAHRRDRHRRRRRPARSTSGC